ncbi:MAG: hypothetical protein HQL55_19810, partial [Magnetococcales bacterium]|nr:hypothetical protein [Magnetococcales bacterium]
MGNIRERRKLVRVDDSLAILWQVMWGEEAESVIGIFKQFGTFPQLHNKPALEEKKTLELEVALRHLGLHAPAIKEGMVALWQEVERLYGLVSPQKKVNPFLPLFIQLVSTAHKLTTLNGISSLHADILKDYRRFLQMAFAADPALSPRQLQQLLRQELTEISKKFRVLYRIAPMQKDVIYPF